MKFLKTDLVWGESFQDRPRLVRFGMTLFSSIRDEFDPLGDFGPLEMGLSRSNGGLTTNLQNKIV